MSTVQCFEGRPKFACSQCSTTIVSPFRFSRQPFPDPDSSIAARVLQMSLSPSRLVEEKDVVRMLPYSSARVLTLFSIVSTHAVRRLPVLLSCFVMPTGITQLEWFIDTITFHSLLHSACNVKLGKSEQRQLLTGTHTVRLPGPSMPTKSHLTSHIHLRLPTYSALVAPLDLGGRTSGLMRQLRNIRKGNISSRENGSTRTTHGSLTTNQTRRPTDQTIMYLKLAKAQIFIKYLCRHQW